MDQESPRRRCRCGAALTGYEYQSSVRGLTLTYKGRSLYAAGDADVVHWLQDEETDHDVRDASGAILHDGRCQAPPPGEFAVVYHGLDVPAGAIFFQFVPVGGRFLFVHGQGHVGEVVFTRVEPYEGRQQRRCNAREAVFEGWVDPWTLVMPVAPAGEGASEPGD